jgi:hypothetical protein
VQRGLLGHGFFSLDRTLSDAVGNASNIVTDCSTHLNAPNRLSALKAPCSVQLILID